MLPVFADPKTDVVFARIFGSDARKPLLIALLNDLLDLRGSRRILAVRHFSLEQRVTAPRSKRSIVDVECTTASGRRFVVEMQVLPVEGFEKRVVYNASKAYVLQLRDAEEYPKLCDVVGVTLCNFKLWPKKIKGHGYKVPMMSRWRMQEQASGHKGLRQIQYAFLELPKYDAGAEPETLVEKWAYFFREAKNLEVVPRLLSEGPFREALEIARRASFTSAEWEEYERAKMAEQDERGAISLARQEGHKGCVSHPAPRPALAPRVRPTCAAYRAKAHPGLAAWDRSVCTELRSEGIGRRASGIQRTMDLAGGFASFARHLCGHAAESATARMIPCCEPRVSLRAIGGACRANPGRKCGPRSRMGNTPGSRRGTGRATARASWRARATRCIGCSPARASPSPTRTTRASRPAKTLRPSTAGARTSSARRRWTTSSRSGRSAPDVTPPPPRPEASP